MESVISCSAQITIEKLCAIAWRVLRSLKSRKQSYKKMGKCQKQRRHVKLCMQPIKIQWFIMLKRSGRQLMQEGEDFRRTG